MKDFFVLLFKCVGIALTVSLTVCFLAWYWGNWRIIVWYVIAMIFVWQAYKYLKTPLKKKEIKDSTGKIISPECIYSLSDKFEELTKVILWGVFDLSILYGIGWFGEWAVGYSTEYFELTIFHGLLIAFACIIVYAILCKIYYTINWSFKPDLIPELLKEILVVIISLGVAIAVLYYCYPPLN